MTDAKNETFKKDCETLINEIKASQAEKKGYFKEVLEGKHEGKKLYQQRIVIGLAEVIDYDKSKLVYEETEADENANRKYLKDCSIRLDKAALQFANELQKIERFSIEEFDLFGRCYPTSIEKEGSPKVEIKCVDLSKGTSENISDVPPEVLAALKRTLDKVIVRGEKGEEKDTVATV